MFCMLRGENPLEGLLFTVYKGADALYVVCMFCMFCMFFGFFSSVFLKFTLFFVCSVCLYVLYARSFDSSGFVYSVCLRRRGLYAFCEAAGCHRLRQRVQRLPESQMPRP